MFPRTSEAKEIVSKEASSIFFFLADKEKGDIRGYMLLSDAGKSGFHVREMWNVNIPRTSQVISNIGNNRATTVSVKMAGTLWGLLVPSMLVYKIW